MRYQRSALAAAIVVMGVVIAMTRSPSAPTASEDLSSSLRSPQKAKPRAASLSPNLASGALPSTDKTKGALITKESSPVARPFPYTKEVASYAFLQAKVFLSNPEKDEKARLLKNPALIRALGERLREASRVPDVMDQQDVAVDLLIEALREGDASAAQDALREVVQDAQVENVELARADREQLAGLKAEVLYQWSAVQPNAAAGFPGLLPGPVSRKIWDNVVRMQQSNQLESLEQARANEH